MHYFVTGKGNRDEFELSDSFICKLKHIIVKIITPNTETIFLNPHGGNIDSSYFRHETDKKRQLTVINWGYHTNNRDGGSKVIDWLDRYHFCSDNSFLPVSVDNEIIFYGDDNNEIPLASFDKEKNRLYLLWDAIHHRRNNESEMFERILLFLQKKLKDHPLFQSETAPVERGYNHTITFNQNLVTPQLRKFRYDYQEKQNSVTEYRSYMVKLLSELKDISRQIAVLESSQSIPPITVKNKWVRHINVSSDGFSIYTHPLFITYVDKSMFETKVKQQSEYNKYRDKLPDIMEHLGKKYGWYVGQFRIDIDLLNSWKVHFHNLDNRRIAFWHDRTRTSNHPHVNGEGKGCLGNLSELISQAQSNFEIETLIDVLIGYIQSANIEDPAGNTVYDWDLVDMETMTDVLTNEKIEINIVNIDDSICDIRDMPMGRKIKRMFIQKQQ